MKSSPSLPVGTAERSFRPSGTRWVYLEELSAEALGHSHLTPPPLPLPPPPVGGYCERHSVSVART